MAHRRLIMVLTLLASFAGCSPAIESASKVVPVGPDRGTESSTDGGRPKSTGAQVKIPMH